MANQNQYTHSSELETSHGLTEILSDPALPLLGGRFFWGEVNYSFGELSCNHHKVAEIYKKPF